MTRKPKIEIDFKCSECGEKQEQNKDKSNENWKIFDMKCPKCGGKIDLVFKE